MELNIDIQKTKSYYSALPETSLCDCGYCKNYRSQIRAAYPEVASYLAHLGIDIEKPFETSPLEPDSEGTLLYCACQYIVFGTCRENYQHEIDAVTFRIANSYPSTGISDEHFILEFSPVSLKFQNAL